MLIARMATGIVLAFLSLCILYYVTTTVHGMINPVKPVTYIKTGLNK